jgi:hypothetical protein
LVAWKQQQAASAWVLRQQQGLWIHRLTASNNLRDQYLSLSLMWMTFTFRVTNSKRSFLSIVQVEAAGAF